MAAALPFALFLHGKKISDDFTTRSEVQRYALSIGVEMEQITGAPEGSHPKRGELDPGYEIKEVDGAAG
jgi:predicted alpha/beta-hydrolase family hydrolase